MNKFIVRLTRRVYDFRASRWERKLRRLKLKFIYAVAKAKNFRAIEQDLSVICSYTGIDSDADNSQPKGEENVSDGI